MCHLVDMENNFHFVCVCEEAETKAVIGGGCKDFKAFVKKIVL